MLRSSRLAFCVFASSCLSGIAIQLWAQTATQASPFSFSTPFGANQQELRAASAAIAADPQFPTQVLLEEATYRIAADGTLFHQFRMIYRIDSPEGVRNWSEVSYHWDPWNENPAKLEARVLQPDGRFVELDQKTVTDAPVKADDSETFSSEHVRRAPLPGLSVGSLIEEVVSVQEKTPFFSGGGIYRFHFREGVPVADSRLIVDAPKDLAFRDAVHGLPTVAINREENGDRRHVVYEAKSLLALHDSDVDLASNEPVNSFVEFATGESWKSVAATYAKLSDPQTVLADTQAILPASLPSERSARIRAIVSALHHNVRYTGVEFGAARLTPERPSEVIRRHYGDCKDKATLLVAMLRAEGIPAQLALLSTGPGQDVDPALPGMNMFDHAIVYVPADGGNAALWIDATAEFFQPGSLPFMDSNREALIVAPETVALTRTPASRPEDSSLTETRTFTLAPYGSSHVVETSETSGSVDANFRSLYGGADAGKVHADLENYAHSAYNAKSLEKVGHNPADDLSTPFALTLDIAGARRGFTSLDEAVVITYPAAAETSLPKWFGQEPPDAASLTSQQKHEMELAEASRPANYAFQPFLEDHRVRVVPPAGFTLRALPADKTTKLGTASLTEIYKQGQDGVVNVSYRFSSGPGNLTLAQALALRSALLELNKREYVPIYFDGPGVKALNEGRIREALEADHAVVAAQASDAMAHVRLARALLQAGIGDQARAEALRAAELDPHSAVAFSTLGWTREHDDLGVRFGKGYDRSGSIEAYKKSIALDPEDNDPRFELAILQEFNARGIRYASDADLPAAIASYKDLTARAKAKNENAGPYQSNLAYALFFAGKHTELDSLLATLPSNAGNSALSIASATAQHGAAAGTAQADRLNAASTERTKNLHTAGTLLAQARLYPEAAAMLKAGIGGGDDAAASAREAEFYANLHPASLAPLPATDAAAPAQTVTLGILSGTLTRQALESSLSRHAYSSAASFNRAMEKNLQSSGFLRQAASKSDMTETVLLDLIAGTMTFKATGDTATGFPIVAEMPGSNPTHFYAVHEDAGFRVVADDKDQIEIGNAVLYDLGHNRAAEAKALLDWKRDFTHKEGGDDPLTGSLLPRFWTVGSTKPNADSPEAMRMAAYSLLAGSMDAKPFLGEIAKARDAASGAHQTDLDLLLAVAGSGAEQPAVSLPAAKRLLDQEPDSVTALRLVGQSYALAGQTSDWLALLAPRVAKKPKDHDLLSEQTRAYQAAGDWANARKSAQGVLDSGKADSNDYNNFAWMGLFDNHLGEDTIKAAQQSNMLSKNSSFADLHTMACVYAAAGRTTEARSALTQAMFAGNLPQPNSAVWYALGLIYEAYGARDAALTAYGKVEAHELDDHTYVDPTSTWLLAQMRIKALNGQTAGSVRASTR